MVMKKKGEGIMWPYIIGGIIAVFVLGLTILVVYRTIRGPISGMDDTSNNANNQGSNALNNLLNTLGKCEDGAKKCSFGNIQVCKDGKWETETECENGCEGDSCK